MKYPIALSLLLSALLLNSCCSSCRKFWDQVDRGAYYDDALQTKVEAGLATSSPDRYKAVARVILTRSGSEQAFTLLANVRRSDEAVSIAGMADLGSVMFIITMDREGVSIKKNNSGWDNHVLVETITPLAKTLFLPEAPEDAIIQNVGEHQVQHRSRRSDGSLETFVFDRKTMLWHEHRLTSFLLFGELERSRRIRFSDFKPVPGWTASYPHRIDVDDEIHGYKASISVSSLTLK